ncbi:MAG: ABC transporter permease [Dongiaceae bacterium]
MTNEKSRPKPGASRGVEFVTKRLLGALGILPFLLLIAVAFFAIIEPRFLSVGNISNVTRQATYLAILSMGKMLVLVTGNFDLSIGSNVALVSIVSTIVMVGVITADPTAVALAIMLGIGAGLLVGLAIGLFNGIGVAVFNVNSFVMTLGTLSIVFGLALMVTGGLPVYGAPQAFSDIFAYGSLFGVSVPVLVTGGLFLILYVVLNWTPLGRYLYAIGSNRRAARLTGINTTLYIIVAHVLCAVIAAIGGLLLTARVATGEAGLGETLPLAALTACVIGGVSLWGGTGRLSGVVLGAFFISMLTNGMNLIGVNSYGQILVTGAALIIAVIADQARLKLLGQRQRD